MKSIVFDSGPIISLTTNNLLWILEKLKQRFNGEFLITETIKKELVDRPLEIKRFEFEALQVLRCINKGIIRVAEKSQVNKTASELLELANSCFKARGSWIRIVHNGEMEGLATCIESNAEAFVIDERTTRILIENPKRLTNILSYKLHTNIQTNKKNLSKFLDLTKNIKVIRSFELVAVAYELGLLDGYLPNLPNAKKLLLDSILWGVKINGCSVSRKEIDEVIKIET